MKEKLKNINWASVVGVVKAALIGVVASILLVLLFAFVLKFVDLSSSVISLVDQIIKVLSILIAVIALNRQQQGGLLVKGVAAGAVYSVITFVVFSVLNGGFNLTAAIFSDILFGAAVGAICSIILNIISKK